MDKVSLIKEQIIKDFKNPNTEAIVRRMVLNAYNDYQEEERDGVDYLFNIIDNQEDLECCVKGGMDAYEISWVYKECNKNGKTAPYFFFGCNHEFPEPIGTFQDLDRHLVAWLDEMLPTILENDCIESYAKIREIYEPKAVIIKSYTDVEQSKVLSTDTIFIFL